MKLNKIRDICEEKKWSIGDLAKKIKVSEPGIYQSMRTGSMKLKTLEEICNKLEISPEEFFELTFKSDQKKISDENAVLRLKYELLNKKFQNHLASQETLKAELIKEQEKTKLVEAQVNELKERITELKEYNKYLKDLPKLYEAIERNSANGGNKE